MLGLQQRHAGDRPERGHHDDIVNDEWSGVGLGKLLDAFL